MKPFIPTLIGACFAFLFLMPISSQAQCTVVSTSPNLSSSSFGKTLQHFGAGQTFQACQTGDLVSISIEITSFTQAPFSIDLVVGTGNDPNVANTIVSTTTHPLTLGVQTITLSAPVSVIGGNDYYFVVLPEANLAFFQTADLQYALAGYAGGLRFDSGVYAPPATPVYTFPTNNFDIAFEANIQPSQQQAVPTMSQWGLILFGLTLLNFGAVVLWKRQHRMRGIAA